LREGALQTEHTFFLATVRGKCADLTAAPWKAAVRTWSHQSDFSGCQALADENAAVRSHGSATLRARRRRDLRRRPRPRSLSLREPFEQQTWACKATADGAWLQRAGGGRYDFPAADWK